MLSIQHILMVRGGRFTNVVAFMDGDLLIARRVDRWKLSSWRRKEWFMSSSGGEGMEVGVGGDNLP